MHLFLESLIQSKSEEIMTHLVPAKGSLLCDFHVGHGARCGKACLHEIPDEEIHFCDLHRAPASRMYLRYRTCLTQADALLAQCQSQTLLLHQVPKVQPFEGCSRGLIQRTLSVLTALRDFALAYTAICLCDIPYHEKERLAVRDILSKHVLVSGKDVPPSRFHPPFLPILFAQEPAAVPVLRPDAVADYSLFEQDMKKTSKWLNKSRSPVGYVRTYPTRVDSLGELIDILEFV